MIREMILKPQGISEVKIEEFENPVYIRRMTAAERAALVKRTVKFEDDKVQVEYSNLYDSMARLVSVTLCDENGNRIFSDSEEDIKELLEKCDAMILEKLYNEAAKLNGLGEEAIKTASKNS